MIDQNEAISISLAVSTAMMNNDKESRELIYADLSQEDLKRVLRWTTRQFITVFSALTSLTGIDPETAWKKYCSDANASFLEDEN